MVDDGPNYGGDMKSMTERTRSRRDWTSVTFAEVDPEGEIYDPAGYRALIELPNKLYARMKNPPPFGWLTFIAIFLISLGLGAVLSNVYIVAIGLAIGFFVSAYVSGSVSSSIIAECEKEYREARTRHRSKVATEKYRRHDNMKDAIRDAKITGHTIVSGTGHTVIIGSTVQNSFNQAQQIDPVLADAITTLAGFVENSGNKDAAGVFNQLHTEMVKPAPNKGLISALWSGLQAILPGVSLLVDVTSKIASLVA